MKRIIILMGLFILLCCSFTYANNKTGTGYLWYDEFDSITDWDFDTLVCGDQSESPELEIVNLGGSFGNVIRSNTEGASCMELDNSDISLQNTPLTINFMTYDNAGYWYTFNLKTVTTELNTIFGGGIIGSDTFIQDASDDSTRTVFQDNDWTANTWYNNTMFISNTFIEYWIDGVLMMNETLDFAIDISEFDTGFTIRTDGNNVGYYDEYKIWYGRPSEEPTGVSVLPVDYNISISLNYPTNATTYYGDYTGVINISLTNVNGTANCGINGDSRWTVDGTDFGNEDVIFYNNTPITETNVTVQIDCWDIDSYYNYTGVWFAKYNILNVSIFDDVTGDLINVTVDMTLYNDDYYNSSFATDNGSIYIVGLTNGTYTAEFSSDNYSNREYFATLGFGETTNLNAYLSIVDSYVVFTTRDRETGSVIQGATVTIKKYIDGTLTTIYVKETDITGRIQFGYGEGVEYYFTITKTGYEDKSFILDPVIFSEYSVYMDSTAEIEDNTDFAGVSITHSPNLFYEGLNNLSITISNPDGALTSYGVNVSYLSNFTTVSGSNAYGSTFDESINVSGSSWGDMLHLIIYYTINGGQKKTFSYNYEIIPEPTNYTFAYNQDKTYGLGEFERVSIFTLITMFVGGIFTIFTGAIAGLGITLLVMGYFIKVGFVSLWYVIIPIFAGSIILIWRESQ